MVEVSSKLIDVTKIDEVLKLLALNQRYRFNAYQVAFLAGNTNVNEVYEYLLTREPYVLKRSFEVLCPNDHSTKSFDKLKDIPDKWMECRHCNTEFRPDLDRIHIVFDFIPSYLRSISGGNHEKKLAHPVLI